MHQVQLLLYSISFISITKSLSFKIQNVHHDAGLNIIQLATKYGYPIESHHVETEDRYILTLHRIPHGLNNTISKNRHPVLLMHGLLSSSVDWINAGPGTALALLLADNGFDVWMGNNRGNTWSRQHVYHNPDTNPEKFFDFSFHEMGVYDLPAIIDYILNKTHQDKLYYIGHSQGTTQFFVMTSEKPEYNNKIKLMTGLAPVAYVTNIPNPVIPIVVESYDLFQTLVEVLEIHEVLPHSDYFTKLGKFLCSDGSPYQKSCTWILNMIAGISHLIDPNFVSVITSNAPAGCSIKQIQHYFQEVKFGNFQKYDYGVEENLIKYKQSSPPLYNISKITAPVNLYYSDNDWLDASEDVIQLAEELPNVIKIKKIPLGQFNHLDFLWARNVDKLLYNEIIADIKATN